MTLLSDAALALVGRAAERATRLLRGAPRDRNERGLRRPREDHQIEHVK
jgi:hypothetical protein